MLTFNFALQWDPKDPEVSDKFYLGLGNHISESGSQYQL